MTRSAAIARPPFSLAASVQRPLAVSTPAGAIPRSTHALFYGWLVARTLLWTLIAVLAQHTPPWTRLNGCAGDREWQWGYHKHPPLAAWVGEIAFQITPGSFFGVYLVGYLAIAVAAVVRLAAGPADACPAKTALAATVCLDGLVYFQSGRRRVQQSSVADCLLGPCRSAVPPRPRPGPLARLDRPRTGAGAGASVQVFGRLSHRLAARRVAVAERPAPHLASRRRGDHGRGRVPAALRLAVPARFPHAALRGACAQGRVRRLRPSPLGRDLSVVAGIATAAGRGHPSRC